MRRKLPVLTMYRHKVSGLDECEHQFQLLGASVTRNVDVAVGIGDHRGPAPRHVIHDPGDGLLIARDHTGREHDGVPGKERNRGMVVDGDSWKGRERLSLRARAQAQHILRVL